MLRKRSEACCELKGDKQDVEDRLAKLQVSGATHICKTHEKSCTQACGLVFIKVGTHYCLVILCNIGHYRKKDLKLQVTKN